MALICKVLQIRTGYPIFNLKYSRLTTMIETSITYPIKKLPLQYKPNIGKGSLQPPNLDKLCPIAYEIRN